jgi:broad specificity phosphatase PhoE
MLQIKQPLHILWPFLIGIALATVNAFGVEHEGWEALKKGGYIIMIRHAVAPGGGDPPNFSLDDCTTQRNLSDEGRLQAQALGEAFRQRQIPIDEVYSSQWCRCKETAQLAFGTYKELPALNSFFEYPELDVRQTEAMVDFLQQRRPHRGNLILVTHQVNITALTDVFPSQGEIIVVTMGADRRLEVIARIRVQD